MTGERGELARIADAARARPQVLAGFAAAAGLAWWWTARRMAGMDAGPGTPLGTLGFFTGAWAVMMAAMMLPSLAPAAAVHAQVSGARGRGRPLLFAAGYLLVWSVAGLIGYALFKLGAQLGAHTFAWHAGGRWLAGGTLAAAALYELTPLKRSCLSRCRDAGAFMRRECRGGRAGALELGARNGLCCLGCTWALMAALFALGVMSLTWMALVAVLVAIEKLLPWRAAGVAAAAVLLLVLAVFMLAAPARLPGLVVPGTSSAAMQGMRGAAMPRTGSTRPASRRRMGGAEKGMQAVMPAMR